ncbi:manganese and iron superoxide dismutase [Delitschia confertaspora ATCC 74209]|uniref:Manganese and iron superoxide dismutase n=1 Tax=Delitschia confertaspora ATCC 74209 TaxID=1513339 RepID=A0A9P4JEW8_9PLEO|nr:manganese and iron superoxide dismutase [Delitschia confertaspora ATCC 74209]
MIIRTLCRRGFFQEAVATTPAKRIAPQFSRQIHGTPRLNEQVGIHRVPKLNEHESLVQNGVPGLLSAQGYKTAWSDYMEYLTYEMNVAVSGKEYQHQTPEKLLIECARDPQRAYLFNLASMAWNNHFFFKGISGVNAKPKPSQPSSDLLQLINHDFSSMDTLREDFLATAEAMFGPGFVWLVQVNNHIRILPTYNAGSPLAGAHYRRQSVDMNTQNTSPVNSAGSFGDSSEVQKGKPKAPFGGVDVTPLLCVNTWEHVWTTDYVPQYGFLHGKRAYLEKWWDKINWDVAGHLAKVSKSANGAQKNRFV